MYHIFHFPRKEHWAATLGGHADAHKQFLPTAPETQILSLVLQLHETTGGLKSQFQSSLNPLPTLAFSMPLETLPRQHGRPWPAPLSSRPPCGCGHWSGPHEEPGHKMVSVTSLQFVLDAGKSGLKRVANLKKRSWYFNYPLHEIFGLSHLGKVAAATRAVLPTPTTVCSICACPDNGTAVNVWDFWCSHRCWCMRLHTGTIWIL